MGKAVQQLEAALRAPLRACLAVALCVGLCPTTALAADGHVGADTAADGSAPAVEASAADTAAATEAATVEPDEGLITGTIEGGLGFGQVDSPSQAGRLATFDADQSNVELAYGLITDAYDRGDTEVVIDQYQISLDDFKAAVARAQVDPELYYSNGQIGYSYYTNGMMHSFTLGYLFDTADLDEIKASFEQQAAIALSWVDDDMSDLYKVQALHDYLVRTVEYDSYAASTGLYNASHTAYGALVGKLSVCQGYAMAYKLLLTRIGIPCIYVSSEAMSHGWNMVMLDGNWYHVDCTWDDPLPDQGFDANVRHDYFLRSDASMTKLDHYGWTSDVTAGADWPAYDMPTFNAPVRPAPDPGQQVKTVAAPMGKTLSYNGAEQVGVDPSDKYTLTGNTATEPGTYTATASLVDKEHYVWKSTGTSDDIQVQWTITEPTFTWKANTRYTLRMRVASPGEVTWKLSNPDVARLEDATSTEQPDGGQIAQVAVVPTKPGFTYLYAYIGERLISSSSIKIVGDKASIESAEVSGVDASYDYTGKAIEPKPVVTLGSVKLTEGVDYTLGYANNVEPGEATLTIEGIGSYTGKLECRFEIVKPEAEVTRIAGDDAAATSAAIAKAAFPEGSEWVVVARDDDFADAMSATGLAGALDAPIVLTNRFGLSGATAAAVRDLGATKAYVVGGKGAVPADLESQLAEAGCRVQGRVFGNDSWDTSVACAEKIAEHGGNPSGDAIVAMSGNFQDALSISSFAYKYQVPIFLETDADNGRVLTAAARRAIEGLPGTIYVPGGPGAVPTPSVEGVFGSGRVQRIYGEEGYDTSNQIATYMVEHGLLSAGTVCVASGAPAPKGVDALAGAALAGRAGGVMLLANDNAGFGAESSATLEGADAQGTPAFLAAHAQGVGAAYLLGGQAVVGAGLEQKVRDLLG